MSNNTAKYTVIQRDLTQTFRETANAATPFYPTVSNMIQSDRADEGYGILGSMPGVREWLGDRQFNELRSADFTIKNKLWENSLLVEKTNVNDDKTGLYGPLMQDLANEAAYHPDELFFTALVNGESTTCLDGQYFFDTDHSWGDSGTQDNDLTYAAATGTVPTAAEFRAAFHAARAAMMKYKSDNGKLLNRPVNMANSNLLVLVNPDFEVIANEALAAPLNSSGATNVVLDRPIIRSSAYLTDTSKMYLFNLSGALKPFVFQQREALTADWKGMDDIETKFLKFMTQARYNLGYLAWWKCVLTTFT